jgi:AraC family transcriptional regulator
MFLQGGKSDAGQYASGLCLPIKRSVTGYAAACSEGGLDQERIWRCPTDDDHAMNVWASRWIDSRTCLRREESRSSSDRHVVSLALKATRVRLASGSGTVFEGIMPTGMLHVSGPSQILTAEFQEPCDFVHLYVSNDYLRRRQQALLSGPSSSTWDMNDYMIRDALVAQLGRTLVDGRHAQDGLYSKSVGETIVMRLVGLGRPRQNISPLPKWRLRRVVDYIDANLDERVSLADLAGVAGLSRMHFASQFRAATGCRPHEYLLARRIDRAKALISGGNMPLVEVALSVGFQAQAHFSTVFRHFAGDTPARWRQAALVGSEVAVTA